MRPWVMGIIVGVFAMTMAGTGDAQKNPDCVDEDLHGGHQD